MPEYTRPATWEDVKALATLLNDAGVDYALVGGYAIAAHGFVRQSEDIDVLVSSDPENSRRWILALSKLPDAAARELAAEPDVFAKRQTLRCCARPWRSWRRMRSHELRGWRSAWRHDWPIAPIRRVRASLRRRLPRRRINKVGCRSAKRLSDAHGQFHAGREFRCTQAFELARGAL